MILELPSFGVLVEAKGQAPEGTVWQATLQSRGAKKPIGVMTAGDTEAQVALDLVRDLRRVFAIGVDRYVSSQLTRDPDEDEEDLRKRAIAFFEVAQGADDQDLQEAERRLQIEAVPPEIREATEAMQKVMSRSFDFGNVKIRIEPSGHGAGGHVWFHILVEAPGGREEDQMLRPPSYPTSRVAQDHFKVMKYVLEAGVPAAVERQMKANYLGEEWRPQAQAYIEGLDQFGRVVGLPDVDRVIAGLEGESEREIEERAGTLQEYKVRAEEQTLVDLKEREAQIVERLKELRERHGKK